MMVLPKYGIQRKGNFNTQLTAILITQNSVDMETISLREDHRKSFIFGKQDFMIV